MIITALTINNMEIGNNDHNKDNYYNADNVTDSLGGGTTQGEQNIRDVRVIGGNAVWYP